MSGRYKIGNVLGEGGMATVYQAFDTHLQHDVALKVIRKDVISPASLEKILKRFEHEARALANLTHTNIVPIIDYGQLDHLPYLVMPLLPGGTLKKALGKPIPYQEAARLLAPIARALEFAHRKNMIHRDVKPSNLLFTEAGDLMLSDFGVAKILEVDETTALTGTGVGIGTPEYMAPEQWVGNVSPQSDQYALGTVFFEMVTGQKPYNATTPVEILLQQTNTPVPRPRQFVAELPEAVE